MANTERLIVLQKVREAKKAAGDARTAPGLTADQRALFENLYVDLDNQEDVIITQALDERIDALRAAGSRLEAVAQQITKEMQKLEKVAEVVDKAAKAIKILADIAGQAGSLVTL
ncbi:hypothetical protein [Geobacter sp.]|uniref:hypothetical protein n=1 Tax=Geobacter sp. TaxID=46610 RepID=UPI0026277346|nr:hypothetical protein [Geobacter sp.]